MINIKIAKNKIEKKQAFKLRYQVFFEEIGYQPHYIDHLKKIIKDPLDDSAKIFLGYYDDSPMATARINFAQESDFGFYSQIYQINELVGENDFEFTSISNYLIVDKKLRGSRIIWDLVESMHQLLTTKKVKFNFLDCEPFMVPWYKKLGYQNMGSMYHPEFGAGNLMMLDLRKYRVK